MNCSDSRLKRLGEPARKVGFSHDFSKHITLHFHAVESGLQPLDFLALRAAGHGLFQGPTLPASGQGRQIGPETGLRPFTERQRLLCLADALSLKRRTYISGWSAVEHWQSIYLAWADEGKTCHCLILLDHPKPITFFIKTLFTKALGWPYPAHHCRSLSGKYASWLRCHAPSSR